MIELYAAGEAEKMKRRAAGFFFAGCFVLLAGVVISVFLCSRIRPSNTWRLLLTVIVLNTLAGWLAIPLLFFGYRPYRAESEHIRHMEGSDSSLYEGLISTRRQPIQIPKSITVVRVLIKNPNAEIPLSLNLRKKDYLPPDGTHVRVCSKHGFITGFEVL